MSSPTQRTLEKLRAAGYVAEVVERFNSYSGHRVDFLGCIDIIAIREGEPPLGIQCTSGDNGAARVRKMQQEPRIRVWLAAGCRAEVWAWRKLAKRGPDGRWWQPKVTEVEA